MAKLLKMLWEYMDLTVLPFFETWSAHILGGGRGCAGALTRPSTGHLLPKNFEKTALRKRWGIFTEITVHVNSVCEKAWDSTTLINTFVFDFQYLENLLPADPSTSINVKNPLRSSQEYLENILRPYLNICSSFCSFVPSLMTRIIIMNSWNFNWFDVPL